MTSSNDAPQPLSHEETAATAHPPRLTVELLNRLLNEQSTFPSRQAHVDGRESGKTRLRGWPCGRRICLDSKRAADGKGGKREPITVPA